MRNRIGALILIPLLLLYPVSCSQRKQSPPEQEETEEKEDKSGYLILINEESPGKNVMYSIGASGKDKKKIFEKNPKSAAGFESKIAILTEESKEQVLNMINAKGSGLTTILKGMYIKDNSFSWSPDGKRLLFIGKGPEDKSNEVYYVEAGENMTPLKITDDVYDDDYPGFSGDGKMIVYVKNKGGSGDIYKYNIGSKMGVNMTNSEADDISPVVLPDRTRMLFLSDEGTKGKYNLHMMNMDGEGRAKLTSGLNIMKGSATNSPDSSMIAFVTQDERKNKTVQIIDMTRTAIMISDDAYMAKWSSDGKKLYYATFDTENRKIVEYDVGSKSMKDIFKAEMKPGQEGEGIKFLHFTDKLEE